jgi:hypothetical protein
VPRYFFHIHDGKNIRDTDGIELAGVAEARNQAIATAGEVIRHDVIRSGMAASGVWT